LIRRREQRTVVPAAGYRTLVVDDSVDAANALSRLLTMVGHEVRTAYDGRSALAAALAFQPEVVILDIGLPDMGGYALAERLRAVEGLAEAVFIALSGAEVDAEQARRAGIDHRLLKPAALQDLLSLFPRRE
jgi:CheY-like chemotaxis protein